MAVAQPPPKNNCIIMKELKNYEYSDVINEKIESLSAAVVNLDVEAVNALVDEISKLI